MGGDAACKAVVTLHGRRRRGEVVEGDRCDGGWVAAGTETMSSGSSTSSLTDEEEDGDGATSSSRPDRDVSSSSLSSLTSSGSETTTQIGEAAGGPPGPLYALSTMMEDLPALRTGLSKHYKGRSQSFTSLVDVSCVEDLAKKTTPYTRRKKAPGRCAEVLGAKNRLSKTISKKAPRGKPPAYQGKREMYRC
ncbi:hypothetical protein SEVIR_4G152600v4 [Setaria viridis]|uniref:Oxidative stress 3 n=1 Tax=Setaria viridis TaxID=4556 RepID=A0A4U6V290_SETVI|nr:uncharacterized protein LOC117854047 [Setaria viridis]TKW21914.1 hypothetical protein SEVIR_4G152600v2 [Setaria viridis]